MPSQKNGHEAEIKISQDIPLLRTLDQRLIQIAEQEGINSYEIDKRCLSTNGGNYLSQLYEVTVKGRGEQEGKVLNIFVKHVVDAGLKIFTISDIFTTEVLTYKDLLKVFLELQEEANIPPEQKYKIVKVYDVTDSQAIIMEDLGKKGFRTFSRLAVPSYKYAERCIQELAKFHALSFVLKERNPDFFESKIKSLRYPVSLDQKWSLYLKDVQNLTMIHIHEKFKDIAQKLFENILQKYCQYLDDEIIKRCLCHGDYRSSNIMTKIVDGEVQELIPIDYQLAYHGSPAFDFLYFIYSCTDRNFRKLHTTKLIDTYYATFKVSLGHFNLDSDVIYPKEEFLMVSKKRRP